MKALFVLLIAHLLTCVAVSYGFGHWREGHTVKLSSDSALPPSLPADGELIQIPTQQAYTEYIFSPPRSVIIYGIAGLAGILFALVAELYSRYGSKA